MMIIGWLVKLSVAAPLCVAHRGNNVDHVENSMAAVRSAVDVGSHGVEFDVHHTADGVPVLFHDKRLGHLVRASEGRECPLNQKISAVRYEDLSGCELENGEPLPLLKDVLAMLSERDVETVVELKDRPSRQTRELLETHFPGGENLIVISFSARALRDLADWTELTRYHLGIGWAKLRQFDGVDLFRVTKRLVRRAHAREKIVGVWTIDDPARMERLASRGVDFITTNDPKACIALFRE